MNVRRAITFDTQMIAQTVRIGNPWRIMLSRHFCPRGDPYDFNYNPHVDVTPYYEGEVTYHYSLRIGHRFRHLEMKISWL